MFTRIWLIFELKCDSSCHTDDHTKQTFDTPRFKPFTILHTIRHVYRSVWPAREAKPRFGAALVRSAHDCEARLWSQTEVPRPL